MTKILPWMLAATTLALTAGASAASAAMPEFVASSSTVSFTAESGKFDLNVQRAGTTDMMECGSSKITGTLVPKSATAQKVTFEGRNTCELVLQGERFACWSSVKFRALRGVIGYVKNEEGGPVGLKLYPESGSSWGSFSCLSTSFEVFGSAVGELPELNSHGAKQYNTPLSSFELNYAASGAKQAIQTLRTSKGFETGLHLATEGLFGGEAAIETKETLKTAEPVEIKT